MIETLKASEKLHTDPQRRYRGFWILGEVLLWMTTWSRFDLTRAGMDFMREVASVAHNVPIAQENSFYDLKNLDADVIRLHKLVFENREPPEEFLVPQKTAQPPSKPFPWAAISGCFAGIGVGISLGICAMRYL